MGVPNSRTRLSADERTHGSWRRRTGAGATLLVAMTLLTAATTDSPVPERIRELVAGFKGVVGIAAIELDTGEVITVEADSRFPTASLIKVALVLEVFHAKADGRIRPDTTVTLTDADKVGGSGVLKQLQPGVTLTVEDLAELTITYSDNTATNLLVGLVGTAAVNRRLDALGLTSTRLFRPTFRDGQADTLPELEREFGLGMTTPREAARLFAIVAEAQSLPRDRSDALVDVLSRQTDRTMIARSLPFERERIVVASKSGTDAEKVPDATGVRRQIRTDAAYVRGPRTRYVVAILARQAEDARRGVDHDALVTGAAISRAIYDHFSRER